MTEFIYNGLKYSTWNLKKELKKMGIKKEAVLVLEVEVKKIIPDNSEYTRYIVRWDPLKNITYNGITHDPAYKPLEGDSYIEYLKNNHIIWNELNKIGYGPYFTEEYARKLILLKGKPKYPLIIGDNNLPILEEVYEDW